MYAARRGVHVAKRAGLMAEKAWFVIYLAAVARG